MKMKFTAPTADDIKEDCEKLNNLFEILNNEMSDVDIAPINELFYASLSAARLEAKRQGFGIDALESYYKLKMWFEMIENMENGIGGNYESKIIPC
jgi:hypothetical protein